jgi:hypothetical protein
MPVDSSKFLGASESRSRAQQGQEVGKRKLEPEGRISWTIRGRYAMRALLNDEQHLSRSPQTEKINYNKNHVLRAPFTPLASWLILLHHVPDVEYLDKPKTLTNRTRRGRRDPAANSYTSLLRGSRRCVSNGMEELHAGPRNAKGNFITHSKYTVKCCTRQGFTLSRKHHLIYTIRFGLKPNEPWQEILLDEFLIFLEFIILLAYPFCGKTDW